MGEGGRGIPLLGVELAGRLVVGVWQFSSIISGGFDVLGPRWGGINKLS